MMLVVCGMECSFTGFPEPYRYFNGNYALDVHVMVHEIGHKYVHHL